MGNELQAAMGFIQAQLTADASLVASVSGIFNAQAPRGTQPPFVIVQYFSSPQDLIVIGGHRIAVEPLYIVKVVGQTGTFKDIEPMADAIDNDLHDKAGGYGAYLIRACLRENIYQMVDTSSEIPWRHLGGYYRLYIQPAGG